jgi:hypothetical protein
MSSPVALPADFASRWATVSPEVEHLNPFSDVNRSASRVTASGFTNTTVRQKKPPSVIVEEDSDLNRDIIDEIDKFCGLQDEFRSMSIKKPTKSVINESRKITKKMNDIASGMSTKVQEELGWEMDRREKYVTLDDFKQFTNRVEASLHPKDSASVFEPAPRTNVMSMRNIPIEGPMSVVGGYQQTVEQKIEELEQYSSLTPVVGLPIIFTNDRLNFLCHLHDPLFKLLSDDDGSYPATDSLDRILDNKRNWNTNAASMLLGQVLDKTIDFRTATVKSNPFELPILEPTMVLTARIVFMCFDQLYKEFEREWFNTFKAVTTPAFSSKYESRKFKSRKYSSSSGSGGSARTESSRDGSRRNSRGSVVSRSSFLGF